MADLLEAAGASGDEQVPVPSWHFVEDPDEDGAAGCAQVSVFTGSCGCGLKVTGSCRSV